MRSWIVFNLPLLFIAALMPTTLIVAQVSPLAGAIAVIGAVQCYVPLRNRLERPNNRIRGEQV